MFEVLQSRRDLLLVESSYYRFHIHNTKLVSTFNKEKALVGAFSVIVKTSRTFVSSSSSLLPLWCARVDISRPPPLPLFSSPPQPLFSSSPDSGSQFLCPAGAELGRARSLTRGVLPRYSPYQQLPYLDLYHLYLRRSCLNQCNLLQLSLSQTRHTV